MTLVEPTAQMRLNESNMEGKKVVFESTSNYYDKKRHGRAAK
jgi:hypothetical protein